MEKTIFDVYPYDDECYSLLKIIWLEKKHNIGTIYVPKTWKVNVQKLLDLGMNISYEFPDNNDHGLLILPSKHSINEKSLITLINNCLCKGKRVINYMTCSFASRIIDTQQLYVDAILKHKYECDVDEYKMKLIDVPVICVCGLKDNTNKLLMQYELKKQFEKEGKKVLWLCSSLYANTVGATDCILNLIPRENSPKIVRQLNKSIVELVKIHNPDVVLIGVSGGIVALNDIVQNDFGVLFYLISHAINIDYTILMIPYNEYMGSDDLECLKDYIKNRFSTEVNTICITNNKIKYIRDGLNHYPLDEDADVRYIDESIQKGTFYITDEDTKVFDIMQRLKECGELNE